MSGAPTANALAVPSAAGAASRPERTYKVICISLYHEDLRALDAAVDRLKARGMTKANRSALIRYALSLVDEGAMPKHVLGGI